MVVELHNLMEPIRSEVMDRDIRTLEHDVVPHTYNGYILTFWRRHVNMVVTYRMINIHSCYLCNDMFKVNIGMFLLGPQITCSKLVPIRIVS